VKPKRKKGQYLIWPFFVNYPWSRRSGLNRRPAVYKTAALPLSYGGLEIVSMEPPVGIEPTTCCLRNSCSASELRWHLC
ncbi:uncharacterized protein METZ01_LOCUS287350, partial [marine metagenome]